MLDFQGTLCHPCPVPTDAILLLLRGPESVWWSQANGLLEAKVDMMRDNLNAARADASAKAALEKEVGALKDQLAANTHHSHSAEQESIPERPNSRGEGRQGSKSAAELEKEVESLQQTVKLLTDQIRSLQVGPSQLKPFQTQCQAEPERNAALSL